MNFKELMENTLNESKFDMFKYDDFTNIDNYHKEEILDNIKHIVENNIKISDYPEALKMGNQYGYGAINFRGYGAKFDGQIYEAYILNSKGDGWLRQIEGQGKGYGLVIRDIKVRSKKWKKYGDYKKYVGQVKYLENGKDEDDGVYDSGNVHLFVHVAFELEDFLSYIKKNMKKWKP